jgi:hypothetical protein
LSSFEQIVVYSQSDRVAALPSPEGDKTGSNVKREAECLSENLKGLRSARGVGAV